MSTIPNVGSAPGAAADHGPARGKITGRTLA
jgi:hypothetical protein